MHWDFFPTLSYFVYFTAIFFKSKMKRQSWTWFRQVLFCPAVTDWLLGLWVMQPAWQQLRRPSPGWGWEPAAEEADVLGTPAGFPASVSLLASISPPLPCCLSPESVTAFSFICIYFPLPSPSTPSSPIGFTPPSLRPCFLAIICMTAAELSKTPLRCWSTLHTVICHLCVSQDVVTMTLLRWHIYRQKTLCLHSLFFTGNRHLSQHVLIPKQQIR